MSTVKTSPLTFSSRLFDNDEMAQQTEVIRQVLWSRLMDARNGFSVGSYGAIAEFHRHNDEALTASGEMTLSIQTTRGALVLEVPGDLVPIAYETLSRRAGCWQHGVVFCLPEARAQGARRRNLTELGEDCSAPAEAHKTDVLFDLGLGAKNVDFCVRTSDTELIRTLRRYAGQNLFDPSCKAFASLLEANPHRVVVSACARAEVYQAIGREHTPEGPHTHVLPKLLRSGRTHSANVPIPKGLKPCFSLHPPSPLFDANGDRKPFEEQTLDAFQELLALWGLPDYQRQKQSLEQAVAAQLPIERYPHPDSRLERTAARIILRQLRARHPESPRLRAWSRAFERR